MSFATTPCFAYRKVGWDAEVLAHPAMAYMHGFTKSWCETKDAHSKPYTDWLTEDFELGSHDGRRFHGEMAAKAFIASIQMYSANTVDVDACYLQETEDGYTGLATGTIYINLLDPGEKPYKDSAGRDWELCVPRAYDCTFVKDPSGPIGGLKLSRMIVYGDLQAVAKAAAKKNVTS